MKRISKDYKGYRKVIYSEGSTKIYSTRKPAHLKTLLNLLKDTAMTRKQIKEETGWTRGQLAGVLHRNRKLFGINNGKISLMNP